MAVDAWIRSIVQRDGDAFEPQMRVLCQLLMQAARRHTVRPETPLPHALCTGLSGVGKSRLVRTVLGQ